MNQNTPLKPDRVRDLLKKEIKRHRDKTEYSVIISSAENVLTILQNDSVFQNIKFNIMRGWPEAVDGKHRRQWTDTDDARMRTYIEKEYYIASRSKIDDAFRVYCGEREYHPVQERLRSIKWDGEERVSEFFIKWMKAEDTPYNRECSRLTFAGGVNRAFSPGCKFDSVPVLIGDQGGGKSTMCQWLAMDSDFYNSTKTMSGQKGYEAISGKWIVEIEELLAVIANEKQGQKVEESAKAFLSTQSDFYRKPYDHRPLDNPRHCIFIGTTNRSEFLTDRTGNRRWYPIRCNQNASYIYRHEDEIRNDIEQCWAEMLAAYDAGDDFVRPTPKLELLNTIATQQEEAEIEDPRKGQIEEYLSDKNKVCLLQIWHECLYPNASNPPQMQRKDSLEISEILLHKLHWERGLVDRFGPEYGRQKSYLRPGTAGKSDVPPF